MIRVAIIDDENHIAVELARKIAAAGGTGVEIEAFDRPRRLLSASPGTPFTHALVDLSYGLWNYDVPENFSREPDLGIDAIDLLHHRSRSTNVAVMTRLDTPLLIEMAIAIREFWPEIRFLHKNDLEVFERAIKFVLRDEVRDNGSISLLLSEETRRSGPELVAAFRSMPSPVAAARISRRLAAHIERPTHDELAADLPYKLKYVRRVVHESALLLREQGWIRADEQAGLDRLWLWCRARRPLLERWLISM